MPKLTDTQTLILSRATTRPANLAMPLPEGLHGAAAKVAVTKMVERGWIEEVDADIRRADPLWRETGDGHGTTLIATETGLAAIGSAPVVVKAASALQKAKPDPAPTSMVSEALTSPAIRAGTKQAQIIALLQRPEGASIGEIVEATGWQAHSARGMISGALKKKLGLAITSAKEEERGTVYSLDA
ncbi:DUF3489 domain-containing protein [Roseovarius tibetensis]|uniref:DUF3489 domain-containing protein n=1 Tax=Roseovarius tibetensis TaxID=2685897 RepID=UPI003D7F9070